MSNNQELMSNNQERMGLLCHDLTNTGQVIDQDEIIQIIENIINCPLNIKLLKKNINILINEVNDMNKNINKINKLNILNLIFISLFIIFLIIVIFKL